MGYQKIHSTLKKLILAVLVCLLLLPLIQKESKIYSLKPLNGSYNKIENPYFSKNEWFDGSYQENQQKYFEQNIGFRSFLVRLYNQMHFYFFNDARANGVVVGKQNYLYEENYIKAYLGRDFIGKDVIKSKVKKITELSVTLKKKGVELIVLLAPGKGSFYPEYIPDRFNPQEKSTANYDLYSEYLKNTSVNLLDLNLWFRNQKSKMKYPLYPKTGIHWSNYAEFFVMDTLVKTIEKSKNIKLNKLVINSIAEPDTVKATDDDIEKGMNLLFDIEDNKMGYPQISVISDSNSIKPKVITVGDSYYWGIFGSGLSSNFFEQEEFWYYSKEIHSSQYASPVKVDNVDIREQVENADVIVLFATDANLPNFAFGFVEQLHDLYFNNGVNRVKQHKEARIKHYINAIKETPEWLESIKAGVAKTGEDLESAIFKNAEYMVWQESQE